MEFDIRELAKIFRESQGNGGYTHIFMNAINEIEALRMLKVTHTAIASMLNARYGLEGERRYTSTRLRSARDYWKKLGIVDFEKAKEIARSVQSLSYEPTNEPLPVEVAEPSIEYSMLDFWKAVEKTEGQAGKNDFQKVKQFYEVHAHSADSATQLARSFIEKKVRQ